MATLLTATVAAAFAPLLVYLYPPPDPTQRSLKLRITLPKPLAELAEGEAVQFSAPALAAFVMADGGGTNGPGQPTFGGYLARRGGKTRAFAITCPHLGCNYMFNADRHRFECPCHGSIFDLEGNVVHGPAVNPLSHLTWEPAATGTDILVAGVTTPT